MNHVQQMIATHPNRSGTDTALLADCIAACFDCAQTCTACADACLGEEKVHHLVRCIRLDQDCFDVCVTTGNLLSRLTESNDSVTQAQLRACAEACRACAEECEQHAEKMQMEHCRICAEACRRCEAACNRLVGAAVA